MDFEWPTNSVNQKDTADSKEEGDFRWEILKVIQTQG